GPPRSPRREAACPRRPRLFRAAQHPGAGCRGSRGSGPRSACRSPRPPSPGGTPRRSRTRRARPATAVAPSTRVREPPGSRQDAASPGSSRSSGARAPDESASWRSGYAASQSRRRTASRPASRGDSRTWLMCVKRSSNATYSHSSQHPGARERTPRINAMEPLYKPEGVEERWQETWEAEGLYEAHADRGEPTFVIAHPPPNVTGELHMGHALQLALADTLVRMKRMQGFNTLFQPGYDHAGISTQNAVEKDLAREGKTRHDLGREAFEARVWEWLRLYGR